LQRTRENLHKEKNKGQQQNKLGHSEFCGAWRGAGSSGLSGLFGSFGWSGSENEIN
jgi:hypothetical protein